MAIPFVCWVCLRAIREQTGKAPGDAFEVVVWKDEEVRTLEVLLNLKT